MADIVTEGDIRQHFITDIAARDGFVALLRRQLAGATEQHAVRPRALAAFRRAQ